MRVGERIDLETSDGAKISAYKAEPASAPKGGIVVLQEAFGVNHHIRSVADRFATAGYAALAPALYDREERGIELGYEKDDIKRGIAIATKIPFDEHILSVEAAIEALAGQRRVGIVGFCLGGSLAYAAAARSERLSAAVGYYGGRIASMAGAELHCPVMLHFGDRDQSIPLSDVEKIEAAHPDMPIFVYPADHGFNCDARGSYDKSSADLAWTRTLAFLENEMRRA